MDSDFTYDPHSERGNACPRNFFGIVDYARLQPVETVFALKRVVQIENNGVTGSFDPAHLRSIHHFLFQDVFPWAGQFRVVNLSKGNHLFAPATHIADALTDALNKLRGEDFLIQLTPRVFAERAAFYLGEINAIHPFREGNGRVQREFIRQLGLHAGHPLTWAVSGMGFTQQQMVVASVLSHTRGDNSQLADIIEAALFSTREGRREG